MSLDDEYIHSIFKDFVDSDILVCSNSGFPVVATYFRILDSNKITIYHPHLHLNNLDGYKNCIPTDNEGNLKWYYLKNTNLYILQNSLLAINLNCI